MEIKSNVKLHNKFVIEVRDAETNELKQTATSYNIILDQMYTRLCAGSTYFVNIHFGTGTGALAANRTSLFTHLGTKVAVDEEQVKAIPTSSWTRKIVINPEEFVGSTFREVGIAFGATTTNLVTHSLLKDDQGSPLEITKTATDVITIYATVFVTLDTSNPNLVYYPAPFNTLIDYLVGGATFPSATAFLSLDAVRFGKPNLALSPTLTYTANTSERKRVASIYRFATTVANFDIKYLDLLGVFSLRLPFTGVYPGSVYNGVAVAMGDGVTKKFKLPSLNIRPGTITTRLDGVASEATKTTEPGFYLPQMVTLYKDDTNVPSSLELASHFVFGDGSRAYRLKTANTLDFFDVVSNEFYYSYSFELPIALSEYAQLTFSRDGARFCLLNPAGPQYIYMYDLNLGVPTLMSAQPVNPLFSGALTFRNAILNANGTKLAVSPKTVLQEISVWDFNGTSWVLRPRCPQPAQASGLGIFGINEAFTHLWYRRATAAVRTNLWDGTSWGTHVHDTTLSGTDAISGFVVLDSGTWAAIIRGGNTTTVMQLQGGTTSLADLPSLLGTSSVNITDSGLIDGNTFYLVSRAVSSIYVLQVVEDTLTLFQNLPNSRGSVNYTIVGSSASHITKALSTFRGTYFRRTEHYIEFGTPPAVGVSVTADYTVDGIHKTDQYVVDASFSIQFGEG